MTEAAPARPSGRYARELTAILLAPVLIWVIGWSRPLVFDAVIAAIALFALNEFLALGRNKGYQMPRILCSLITLFIIAAFVLTSVSVEMGMFAALLFIPASYVLRRDGKMEDALPASGIAVLATMYVGMLAGSLIRLRNDFAEGPNLIFFLLLVVWLGDAGAYYVGKNLGRRKLAAMISPKKTIEGLIGGVITSIVTALVIHFTFFPEFPLPHVFAVAVVLSVAGVVGDLAESLWKRSAAVKDSGSFLPGHGGFLDRFDSILFTAPILYIYWAITKHGLTTLNIISG